MSLVIAGFPEASAHSTPGKSVEETPSAEHAPRKRRRSTMIGFPSLGSEAPGISWNSEIHDAEFGAVMIRQPAAVSIEEDSRMKFVPARATLQPTSPSESAP